MQAGQSDLLRQDGDMNNETRVVDVDRGEAVFAPPLTRSVQQLIDATIRTEVDEDTVVEARALIERALNCSPLSRSPAHSVCSRQLTEARSRGGATSPSASVIRSLPPHWSYTTMRTARSIPT